MDDDDCVFAVGKLVLTEEVFLDLGGVRQINRADDVATFEFVVMSAVDDDDCRHPNDALNDLRHSFTTDRDELSSQRQNRQQKRRRAGRTSQRTLWRCQRRRWSAF